MKKTLLIAAAALAASVISSQAQVYSQNIVGYVNKVLPGGGAFSLLSNPLQAPTNAVDQILSSIASGDVVFIWTGTQYYSSTFIGPGSGPGGEAWLDQNSVWTNSIVVKPGQGFFFSTQSGNKETNTFVGTVKLTNSIPLLGGGAFSLIGSTPPIGGPLDSTNFGLAFNSGDVAFIWTGTQYYSSTFIGPGSGPGGEAWLDQNSVWTNAPALSVGDGFYFSSQSGSANTWNQNLVIP